MLLLLLIFLLLFSLEGVVEIVISPITKESQTTTPRMIGLQLIDMEMILWCGLLTLTGGARRRHSLCCQVRDASKYILIPL